MKDTDIAHLRLHGQAIAGSTFKTPYEVVKWLGAVQAQDYLGTLWVLGLRIPGSTEQDIKKAVDNGSIVRSWPQRGTLHFMAPEEVRWRLELTRPRIMGFVRSIHRRSSLNDTVFEQCKQIFTKALAGKNFQTRPELMALLENRGVSTKNQRGYHILWYCAQTGHIIFGPPRGKQQTFALLDEWVPKAPEISRGDALARLAKSYFTSHGPATVHDLAWWSGSTVADAKAGLDAVKGDLQEAVVDGKSYWMAPTFATGYDPVARSSTFLLPGFDEYLLGYKDRTAALDQAHNPKIVPGSNGMFLSTVVIDGKVQGVWKRDIKGKKVVVQIVPFGKLSMAQQKAIHQAANIYGQFLGLETELTFQSPAAS